MWLTKFNFSVNLQDCVLQLSKLLGRAFASHSASGCISLHVTDLIRYPPPHVALHYNIHNH